MCEKVIKNRWVEYLEGNNVIVNNQFGFRKGRFCITNLICFYSRVTDIIQEKEGWADCIYLDLIGICQSASQETNLEAKMCWGSEGSNAGLGYRFPVKEGNEKKKLRIIDQVG